jgi:hypothetical protein
MVETGFNAAYSGRGNRGPVRWPSSRDRAGHADKAIEPSIGEDLDHLVGVGRPQRD